MNSRVVVPLSWIRRVLIIIFFASPAYNADCQSIARWVITPFGNSYDNNFQIVQATLGEPVIMTVTDSTTFFLTQGFQQPSPTRLITIDNDIFIKIFPNPVTDKCSVEFYISNGKNFTIEVWDMMGKLFYKEKIPEIFGGQRKNVDFTHALQGIYFIHVYSENEMFNKIEKVVKL